MDLQLSEKSVLVTGSTQGIGRAMAEAFLEEGAEVFINGRTEARVQEVVEALSDRGTVRPAPGDISSPTDVEEIVKTVQSHGTLDVLVNNAATFDVKPFEEITDEEWREYFEVNVLGAVRLTRAFLPPMLEQDWGRVIMVSSEAAVKPVPFFLHYSTTKSALLGLARGLAELTKGTGVTVNGLLPGPTMTEGVRSFFEGVAEEKGQPVEEVLDGYFEEEEPTSLLQRFEKPEEVAKVAVMLCGEEMTIINGTSQRAEGGIIRSIL